MAFDRLRIEIDHNHRNAGFFETRHFFFQRVILPIRQHHHIGFHCQGFLKRKCTGVHIADVADVLQRRDFGAVERPTAGVEFLPKFARNTDHIVKFIDTGYGNIIRIIKAQHHTFGRHIDPHFAPAYVGKRFHFGTNTLHGKTEQGSG